ncbi:MAG: helix-turn-helix domain-containing protein [Bdellovibrionota bacterium]
MHSRLINVAEAAEQLGIASKTLYKWVESGQIPYVRIGRLIRFREADLEEWLEINLHGLRIEGARK